MLTLRELWTLYKVIFTYESIFQIMMALPRGTMVCLRFVIVVFPDHTNLLFCIAKKYVNGKIYDVVMLRQQS